MDVIFMPKTGYPFLSSNWDKVKHDISYWGQSNLFQFSGQCAIEVSSAKVHFSLENSISQFIQHLLRILNIIHSLFSFPGSEIPSPYRLQNTKTNTVLTRVKVCALTA